MGRAKAGVPLRKITLLINLRAGPNFRDLQADGARGELQNKRATPTGDLPQPVQGLPFSTFEAGEEIHRGSRGPSKAAQRHNLSFGTNQRHSEDTGWEEEVVEVELSLSVTRPGLLFWEVPGPSPVGGTLEPGQILVAAVIRGAQGQAGCGHPPLSWQASPCEASGYSCTSGLYKTRGKAPQWCVTRLLAPLAPV